MFADSVSYSAHDYNDNADGTRYADEHDNNDNNGDDDHVVVMDGK